MPTPSERSISWSIGSNASSFSTSSSSWRGGATSGGGGGGGGGFGTAIVSVVLPLVSGSGVRERSGCHVDRDPAEVPGVQLDPRRDVAGRHVGPAVVPPVGRNPVADDDPGRQRRDPRHDGAAAAAYCSS